MVIALQCIKSEKTLYIGEIRTHDLLKIQVFVVHGVGQVVDDTTIIRNTNILRDNMGAMMTKYFPRFHVETGQVSILINLR
jgi:hypothetical protein